MDSKTKKSHHYTRDDLAKALRVVGITKGAVVFTHSNLGFLGIPEGGNTKENVFQTVLGAFLDVLGPEGTLCVPTFTYSFCKRQDFNPETSPSTVGLFTEMLRQHPDAVRSLDPIFSVAAIGAKARELLEGISNDCFGPGSFWERLRKANGLICNVGIGAHAVFLHHIEDCLNVKYRYKKLFTGNLIINGAAQKHSVLYRCHDMNDARTVLDTSKYEAAARSSGAVIARKVGRGEVNCITCEKMFEIAETGLKRDKWFLTVGPKDGEREELAAPTKIDARINNLSQNATPAQLTGALWQLPRDIVSDGYDSAMLAIQGQIDALKAIDPGYASIIHKYPTGTEAYTWIVPEKWTCDEAWLETMDGRRLFSYTDHPLHVMSYSLPFEGEVSRDELMRHLHSNPRRPDAIPFMFKYYERDWGLCCPDSMKRALTDERYRVVIRSRFEYGELKVGEFILPGESDESFVLCAHLCHPHLVQDDMAGVAAGVEVMRRLARRRDRRHTIRFLILPETIGSVCWLSHNEALHGKIVGGLFLEMLGLPHPHALQRSFRGDTELDRLLALTLKERDPEGWTGAFRRVIGNDERQFNAPGIRIPMLSLSRVLPRDHAEWPFREYHTSEDNLANFNPDKLEESVALICEMLHNLDRNTVLVNNYKGEVFCSRYAFHIDYAQHPEEHAAFFGAMDLIDGTRTPADIAATLNVKLSTVFRIVEKLRVKNLVK